MSTLLLVRHGQARAFEADSDHLTERGREQARALGEHWVATSVVVDEVRTGTLERQRDTARLVGEAYSRAGLPWPEARHLPEWNEYDAGGILGTLMPELAARDAAFAALVAEFQSAAARADRNRHFQRMFEVLMNGWQEGSTQAPSVEAFAAFHARVRGAFRGVVQNGSKGTVAVFTSGGPIGVCVQEALDAPPRAALRLNWRVQNCSVTEMIFSEERVSLDHFNVVGHFPREMRTFR